MRKFLERKEREGPTEADVSLAGKTRLLVCRITAIGSGASLHGE